MQKDIISRARNIFATIFVVSLVLSIILLFFWGPIIGDVFSTINSSLCGDCPPPETTTQPQLSLTSDYASLGWLTTVITAVTSLVGLISTAVLGWKKDKHEAKLADLERKRLEGELEKKRIELDELKKKNT